MNTKQHFQAQSLPKRQQGFALFMGLAILILLSLIGITAMQSSTLQEKMAGNYKVQHEAFQSTESQVVNGEIVLQNTITAADVNPMILDATNNVLLAQASSTNPTWTALTTTLPTASAVEEGKVNLGVSLKTNNSNNVYYYYVSGAGVGPNPGGSAIVQTTYVH